MSNNISEQKCKNCNNILYEIDTNHFEKEIITLKNASMVSLEADKDLEDMNISITLSCNNCKHEDDTLYYSAGSVYGLTNCSF